MFLETRRKQTRFPEQELNDAAIESISLTPARASQIDSDYVLQALGQVDEIYQAPVALFYLEDCSYKEIAEILDLPIGTVKSRMARGIGQLQKMLAGDIRTFGARKGGPP